MPTWEDLPLEECLRGGEAEMLVFALDRARRQFAWKTGGLTAEQLGRRHAPSSMSLAGLVRHMTHVDEDFTARARGLPEDERPRRPDEWAPPGVDDADAIYASWYAAATAARRTWLALSADGGLDVEVPDPDPAWTKTRRRVLVDLLEEYLKHTGHADLLREAVDGLRGNDPP